MILSAKDCAKTTTLVKNGHTENGVAQLLNVSHSTIQEYYNVLRLIEILEGQVAIENGQPLFKMKDLSLSVPNRIVI